MTQKLNLKVASVMLLSMGFIGSVNGGSYQSQSTRYPSYDQNQNQPSRNQPYYQDQNQPSRNQPYYQDQNQPSKNQPYYQDQNQPSRNQSYYQDQSQNDSSYFNRPASGNQNGNYGQISGGSDQELTDKIRDKIGSGWFSRGYENVNVKVENGVVTLRGYVKTWEEKEKLDKEVRNMDNVKTVNSLVNVQEPNSKRTQEKFSQDTFATPADEQLNRKIRDSISKGWLWDSYKDITLNTSNGVVTMGGAVRNLNDQQKLMSEIQKHEGVKSVKSNLRIQQ